MSKLTPYQTSLGGATWIDVNTNVTLNSLPDRLPDEQAIILCSLYNLFNCPIGARSRIFEPEYGSVLYGFLQEPIDEQTAEAIQIGLIQAIQRWEPRITLDYSNMYVIPDLQLPGYRIRIAYFNNITKELQFADFVVNAHQ